MESSNRIESTEIYKWARKDFKTFVGAVIGLHNQPFHDELDDVIGNPLYKRVVISYPRGHGKSTHLSVSLPLWLIAKNHNLRILLISATETVSRSFLTEIVGHIDRNDDYREFSKCIDDPSHLGVIPRMKNYIKTRENWSGDSILIDRDQLTLKDPTINAVGLFGSILSKRADVIICDDIVNQENSATEVQRQKVIDWIYTTVMPVLVPGGSFIYLGNTWHQDDLVARLLKSPQFDYRKRSKAILSDSKNMDLWDKWATLRLNEEVDLPERIRSSEDFYQLNQEAMDEGVEVLWPSKYTYKDLYLLRMENPYAFARMYQCDPSDRPDQKFKDAWIEEACRKGKNMRLQMGKRTGFEMLMTTEGLDLAISEKETSDDTAYLTIDRVKFSNDPDIKPGDVIVRNIIRGKMSPNTVKDMVKDHYDNLQPDGIRVETVGYQEAIQRDLDDMGVPVHGYHTGGEKKDPYIGINSLAIYAENGKLVLPFDQTDPHTVRLISQLINEMRAFPDGHTGDSLMALWFAFSEMRDLLGNRIVVPSIETQIKDPPDLKDPEVLKEENKKADLGFILQQEEERAFFRTQMGGRWHG
jgi:hypothetical protein